MEGDYRKVYDEIVALKELCGDVHLKTIIEVGDLKTYENIRKASLISLVAGSDFIKTSTGKLSVGSSRQACYVMSKAVLDFYHMTGIKAGIKVAGGIRDAKDAIRYLVIVNEEMGVDWLSPDMFRFGASSLLDDVLKQIRKLKTGAYQANIIFLGLIMVEWNYSESIESSILLILKINMKTLLGETLFRLQVKNI